MEQLNKFLNFELWKIKDSALTLGELLFAFLILIVARIGVWLISTALHRRLSKNIKGDTRRLSAIIQLVKYFVYVVAVLLALNTAGFGISYLLAGSAALFVGLGFGLQATFNDFVSGLIILFEGTIEVDDIVEVDGLVGKVSAIGLRTSQVITRNAITVIIPNAKFTSDNVVNWSHSQSDTRFLIKVGVAYGSDVDIVEQLLIEAAKGHARVLETPAPRARLADFGESSLDFELLFWTREPFEVEFTKGDLRKRIVHLFERKGVIIPFPQRDLHIMTDFRHQPGN